MHRPRWTRLQSLLFLATITMACSPSMEHLLESTESVEAVRSDQILKKALQDVKYANEHMALMKSIEGTDEAYRNILLADTKQQLDALWPKLDNLDN